MNIVIANSQDWFTPCKEILAAGDVSIIDTKSQLTVGHLEKLNPDYVFFPHWNWIVPSEIHSQFQCVVFHTAPLPFGRGGSPIQNLILRGFKSSPVCAIQMSDELDAGPIFCQKIISLKGSLTTIFERLNQAVNKLMVEIVSSDPAPVAQSGTATVFKRIPKAQNQLPDQGELETLYDRIRMLDHKSYPSAYIKHGEFTLEFYDAHQDSEAVEVKCRISKC